MSSLAWREVGGDLVFDAILGARSDAALADRLHQIEHCGVIEVLVIEPIDLPRRRFHAQTDRHTPCFVSLPRSTPLFDGAVLHLDDRRAIVVRVGERRWLRVRPTGASALELGYLAGNLHWQVRFDDGCLLVAIDGAIEPYLARLRDMREAGAVALVE